MTGQKRVQRLADWLIRRSGRRLPDGTREERLREWTAELTAILDDAGITRLRRKARAIRFSAGVQRAARRMTRSPGTQRPRVFTVRAAAAAAVTAVVLVTISLVLGYVFAPAAESATGAAVILLAFLGIVAGAASTVLLAALGVARVTRRRGERLTAGARPARLRTRPARVAAAAFFAAVISLTIAIITGTASQANFPGNSALAWFATAMGITGLACLALLIGMALAAAVTRLWHLARRPPAAPTGHRSTVGQQPH
jgi:amino acid transporter